MKKNSSSRFAAFGRSLLYLAALWALLPAAARAQGWQQAVKLPAGADSNDGYADAQRTATDATGNVYVVGGFYGIVSFGGTTLASTGPDQERDFFVAKLSPAGQWLWAVQGGGAGRDLANDVAVNAAGEVYITGNVGLSATLGSLTLTSSTGSYGNDNMFVAKLSAAGQFLWATKGGGQQGQSLALDAAGNVLVAGIYANGSATIGSTTLANYGSVDVFVAKLDATGTTWQWAVRGGGTGNDYVTQIGADAAGNAYITGDYSANFQVQFGPFSLINANGYVAKLSPGGQFVYATKMVGGNTLLPKALVVEAAGNAYVTGSFRGTNLILGTVQVSNIGGGNSFTDGFIARISPTGTWQWATRFGGTSDDSGEALALDTQGNLYAAGSFTSTNVSFGGILLSATGIIGKEAFVARLSAATGQWSWATAAGGFNNEAGQGLSVSPTGDVNLTGNFSSPRATFGSTALSSTATSWSDVFVAQLNGSTGTWTWAVSSEGGGVKRVLGTCADAAGNVYVTGTFTGTATFGSTTLDAGFNGNEVFVAKRGPAGQWLWAAQAGGGASDQGTALATDAAGNVYVTGTFAIGSFALAVPPFSATFGTTVLTTRGSEEVFVAKLDPAGQWQWAVQAGGTGIDVATAIGVDAVGAAFVAGSYYGGAPAFGTVLLPASGGQGGGAFVAHIGPTGQWRWAVRAGNDRNNTIRSLAVDASGNPVVTGGFGGTAAFGPTSLTSAGGLDVYVAKLDASTGTWLWATRAGGTGTDESYALALDAAGSPVLTGVFGSRAAFGATTLTGRTSIHLFVARFTAAGQPAWAVAGTGTSLSEGAAITLDASGTVYVAGQFQDSLRLGSTRLVSTMSTGSFPSPSRDLLVARLSPAGVWQQAVQSEGGAGSEYATGIALGAGGQLYVAGYTYSRSVSFGASTINSYNTFATGFLAQPGALLTAARASTGAAPSPLATLFPNPAVGQMSVLRLTGAVPGQPLTLTATDALGRVRLRRVLPVVGADVALPEALTWPAGAYLLTLRQGTVQQTLRLVQ